MASAPIEVIACVVSDAFSLARFRLAKRSHASTFIEGFGLSQISGVRGTRTVLTVPLDWVSE